MHAVSYPHIPRFFSTLQGKQSVTQIICSILADEEPRRAGGRTYSVREVARTGLSVLFRPPISCRYGWQVTRSWPSA